MTKILTYLGHARDCNVMALSAASDEHRKLLLEMANTWRTLAREHARMTGQPMPDSDGRTGEPLQPTLPPAPPKKSKLQAVAGEGAPIPARPNFASSVQGGDARAAKT